jgi:SAM-dependent methyltransferase
MKITDEPISDRRPFQGMAEIVAFNWRLYAMGIAAFVVASLVLKYAALGGLWRMIAVLGMAATIFWTASSLVASHWIYDRSALYKWTWLVGCFREPPRCWVNIHVGLDESSRALHRLYPDSEMAVLDVFDPREMTEPSIAEARLRTKNAVQAKRADFRALPLEGKSMDAVFLIFAAHEIRSANSRTDFFGELERILKPGGRIVLVEQLRDWRNFAAFGPGYRHFQSRKAWLSAARESGLAEVREFRITPFVKVFVFGGEL